MKNEKKKGKGKGCKALLVSLFLLSGCTCNEQFTVYVMADRKFFDVQEKHYLQLLDASDTKPEDKITYKRLLTAKSAQLAAAEEALGIKK